jgi:glycosyltransferase involved in cell wall biosynthesis
VSADGGAGCDVAVVIPCYREADRIMGVLDGIGPEVTRIIVVDDACPERTGERVKERCRDPRVDVVVHDRNRGVGGATVTGYRRALEEGADVIVKVDGDGQMDPGMIPRLIAPIVRGDADYTKGNRFHDLAGVSRMPAVRILGNLGLSFACKLSSGYWNIFDPTNGFTAIHAKIARELPLEKISEGYFFESDMLFRLNLLRAVVVDVPMRARYGEERSNLTVRSVILPFAGRHWVNAVKRVFYSYYLRDFNVASIQLVLGTALMLFGVIYGAIHWQGSFATGTPATAGTVVLAALPIILGSQMLIAFVDFDTRSMPARPLHPRL